MSALAETLAAESLTRVLYPDDSTSMGGAVTLLSLGMPMILKGNQVRRTQGGDSNAHCQDNGIHLFDCAWSRL